MQHACCAPLVGMLPLADVSGNIHVPNLGEQQYMFKYMTEHITIKNLHSPSCIHCITQSYNHQYSFLHQHSFVTKSYIISRCRKWNQYSSHFFLITIMLFVLIWNEWPCYENKDSMHSRMCTHSHSRTYYITFKNYRFNERICLRVKPAIVHITHNAHQSGSDPTNRNRYCLWRHQIQMAHTSNEDIIQNKMSNRSGYPLC